MTPAGEIPREITRMQRPVVLAAIGGIVLLLLGLMFSREQFFRSYLIAWLFVLGISFGGLAITLLGHLVDGEWAWLLRRLGEAAALNFVVVAALFIPLLFGLRHLFPWALPELVKSDHILQHKAAYLNATWFVVRAVIYFVIWLVLAARMRSVSVNYDRDGNPDRLIGVRSVAAPGLLLMVVTMTLASVDWILSRDAHWYSTMIGFAVVIGSALNAMAFMVYMLMRVAGRDPIAPVIEKRHLNDLGNLLLTLVILWAYVSFAQFLVIWMGNSREDNTWYIERGLSADVPNGWQWFALILIVLHFFVPFFILLSRDAKRRVDTLKNIALLLLVMRFLDVIWMIAPTVVNPHATRGRLTPILTTAMIIAALLAIGGIWLATFIEILKRQPLLPLHSPLDVDSHDNVHLPKGHIASNHAH